MLHIGGRRINLSELVLDTTVPSPLMRRSIRLVSPKVMDFEQATDLSVVDNMIKTLGQGPADHDRTLSLLYLAGHVKEQIKALNVLTEQQQSQMTPGHLNLSRNNALESEFKSQDQVSSCMTPFFSAWSDISTQCDAEIARLEKEIQDEEEEMIREEEIDALQRDILEIIGEEPELEVLLHQLS